MTRRLNNLTVSDEATQVTLASVDEATRLRHHTMRYRYPALNPSAADYHEQLVRRCQELNQEYFNMVAITESTQAYDIQALANEQTVTINGQQYNVRMDRIASQYAYDNTLADIAAESATKEQATDAPATGTPTVTANVSAPELPHDFGNTRRHSVEEQSAILTERVDFLNQNITELPDTFAIELAHNRQFTPFNQDAHGCATNSNALAQHIMKQTLQTPTVTPAPTDTPTPTDAPAPTDAAAPTPTDATPQVEPEEITTLLTPRNGLALASGITQQVVGRENQQYCSEFNCNITLNQAIHQGKLGVGDEIALNRPDPQNGMRGCHAMIIASVEHDENNRVTGYTLAANNPPALTHIDANHPTSYGNRPVYSAVRTGQWTVDQLNAQIEGKSDAELEAMIASRQQQISERIDELGNAERFLVEHNLQNSHSGPCVIPTTHNPQNSSDYRIDGNKTTHNADGYVNAYQQNLTQLRGIEARGMAADWDRYMAENPTPSIRDMIDVEPPSMAILDQRLAQTSAQIQDEAQRQHEERMRTDRHYRRSYNRLMKQARKEANRAMLKEGKTELAVNIHTATAKLQNNGQELTAPATELDQVAATDKPREQQINPAILARQNEM